MLGALGGRPRARAPAERPDGVCSAQPGTGESKRETRVVSRCRNGPWDVVREVLARAATSKMANASTTIFCEVCNLPNEKGAGLCDDCGHVLGMVGTVCFPAFASSGASLRLSLDATRPPGARPAQLEPGNVEPTSMAYFPDGERYTYYPQDQELACVGWLSVDHPFPTATPSAEFLEKLAWLCVHEPELRMRGFHTCDLCPATVENTEKVGSVPFRRPEHVLVKGRKVLLGSAEIRIPYSTRDLRSPGSHSPLRKRPPLRAAGRLCRRGLGFSAGTSPFGVVPLDLSKNPESRRSLSNRLRTFVS